MMLDALLPPAAGLLLLAVGAAVAGEPAGDRAGDDQAPPTEEAEAEHRPPPTEALPGPRLSDRPFRPEGSDPSDKGRSADRDCCDMEH
ncbi:hypothetical protein [Thiohalorhabdus sp.]|uniref:hypothetical protein n=1 Tax=Thiohalorhabdus sp. TaxID=3094134 RepID=UPI002FC353F2